ncbi:MAG: hypothetical protein OEQ24_10215 [Gammaproteobacteria bacterium]|nr:hypothetical protein [Gammaproteobacteria bacterium]NNC69040.1 hypothetical protein [Gammaproteobacteria bacterium]
MSAGFRSIEMARRLYGLNGKEQREFLDTLEWAGENDKAKKYLRLYTNGEITREQFMNACKDLKKETE